MRRIFFVVVYFQQNLKKERKNTYEIKLIHHNAHFHLYLTKIIKLFLQLPKTKILTSIQL